MNSQEGLDGSLMVDPKEENDGEMMVLLRIKMMVSLMIDDG